MNENEMQGWLMNAVDSYAGEEDREQVRCDTFADKGILTDNAGLVVRIGDSTFQVTIVKAS